MAISIDDVEDAVRMSSLAGAEYPVLADPSEEVTRRYGVFNLLGDGVAAPATFIIAKSGEILWGQVGRNISDRPSPGEILDQLDTHL